MEATSLVAPTLVVQNITKALNLVTSCTSTVQYKQFYYSIFKCLCSNHAIPVLVLFQVELQLWQMGRLVLHIITIT